MLTPEEVAAYGGAGLGLAGAVAYLRRRFSSDSTDIAKEKVEGRFVEVLLKERDAARAAADTAMQLRQVDAAAIARLTAENEEQEREIARLRQEFNALKRMLARLRPDAQQFLASGFHQDETPRQP